MFRVISFRIIFVFSMLFISGMTVVYCQIDDAIKQELKDQAFESFEDGNFEQALSDYQILMNKFPRDPMYRYYCGACMVELNQDYEVAIEMLHFSSTRGVPEDVYFYLGEAYRKMYDFKKAKQYFLQFDKEAPRAMTKERHSKLLVRSIQAASRITMSYNPFEVINVTSMNMYDPDQYSQVRMKGGRLEVKPDAFFSEGEERGDLNSLMFMPERVERGAYVYFTAYEKSGKNGSQIFQAKRGNTGKWIDIKAVQKLNTELNEILPYFDPVSKDIYFASDGFEGIGGFDLYRSHFDEDRKEWSDPINLGFPINSAFDDYLLLPGKDLGMVMFFTGRSGSDSATAVYRVHFSEPKISLASETPEKIRQISMLGGKAAEVFEEVELTQVTEQTKKIEEPVRKVTSTPYIIKEVKTQITDSGSEYQSMVSGALKHQTVSDSLTELSTNARIKVRESDDPNDRWLYQKQIMVWEKKAINEQKMADDLYAKIADYKPQKIEDIPDAIEKDTVISKITVYRFTETYTETPVVDKSKSEVKVISPKVSEAPQVQTPVKKLEKTSVADFPQTTKSLNRFVMLAESPYSYQNPIPVNTTLPAGSFYRIQLGAFSKAIAPDAFGGLSPITGETIPERNLTKYYAGKFSKYTDAVNALSIVRSAGFEQAFIVSWYNGSKLTLEKVRKLEK